LEFLTVTANKMKIVLTAGELLKYGISAEAGECQNEGLRQSFWKILDVARKRAGFDVTGDKVLLQFYPMREGGELFVTRLGKIAEGAERSITRSQNVTVLSSQLKIYKFEHLTDLIAASRALPPSAASRPSMLYYSEDGAYYLLAEDRGNGIISDLSILSEYGREIPITLAAYINEHSRVLLSSTPLSELAAI